MISTSVQIRKRLIHHNPDIRHQTAESLGYTPREAPRELVAIHSALAMDTGRLSPRLDRDLVSDLHQAIRRHIDNLDTFTIHGRQALLEEVEAALQVFSVWASTRPGCGLLLKAICETMDELALHTRDVIEVGHDARCAA